MAALFKKKPDDAEFTSRNLEQILTWAITTIAAITIFALLLLLIFFFNRGWPFAMGTFLLIAAALFASGCVLGFLFGIPKVEKGTTTSQGSSFSDNVNLEDISDWLTKIIVGLTLVQFNNIKDMLHQSAISFRDTFGGNPDFYSAGYATIIFYSAAGFLVSYFWTRTNYVYILEKGKVETSNLSQLRVKYKNLQNVAEDLKTENASLTSEKETAETEKKELSEKFKDIAQRETSFWAVKETSNAEFKPTDKSDPNTSLEKKVDELLASHKILDPEDSHKNRWGGQSEANGRKLEAKVTESKEDKTLYDTDGYSLYDIEFKISSTDPKKQLTETVVLLLHESFGKGSIIYLKPENNKVEITIPAYEAFTAAAICDNGTTFLELDLNKREGNPPGFNY